MEIIVQVIKLSVTTYENSFSEFLKYNTEQNEQ